MVPRASRPCNGAQMGNGPMPTFVGGALNNTHISKRVPYSCRFRFDWPALRGHPGCLGHITSGPERVHLSCRLHTRGRCYAGTPSVCGTVCIHMQTAVPRRRMTLGVHRMAWTIRVTLVLLPGLITIPCASRRPFHDNNNYKSLQYVRTRCLTRAVARPHVHAVHLNPSAPTPLVSRGCSCIGASECVQRSSTTTPEQHGTLDRATNYQWM